MKTLKYREILNTAQTMLKGHEHKQVVHFFMPFSVICDVGTATGKWAHPVLTWSLWELAAFLRDICDSLCAPGGDDRHMFNNLYRRLSDWLDKEFVNMFGETRRPKLHKIMSHLINEFLFRGNVQCGDTGVSESLHKLKSLAWLRTNGRLDDYALQLMMAEKLASLAACMLDSASSRDMGCATDGTYAA